MKIEDILICPNNHNQFEQKKGENVCLVCGSSYDIKDNIIITSKNDAFYEGTYLGRINYNPKKDNFFSNIPLNYINGGYLKYVKKNIKKGSVILELGCAGGVRYFGSRYKMIGTDISFKSLQKSSEIYNFNIQSDISKKIPLKDNSVDAVVSSYFWEHIHADMKEIILQEIYRILKPNGIIVFIYDVETNNPLLRRLKNKDIDLYKKLFIDQDQHIGYQTQSENKNIFTNNKFEIIKHFGMERTIFQSQSVYKKIKKLSGFLGLVGKIGSIFNKKGLLHIYIVLLVMFDNTIGLFFNKNNARIFITVAKKK